jgi:uncharacterized protein (DUF1501 family)
VGPLVEPLTLAEFRAKSKRIPPFLQAHNMQQSAAWTVDAELPNLAEGVLGRVSEALGDQAAPFHVASYSLAGRAQTLRAVSAPFADVISPASGVVRAFGAKPAKRGALAAAVANLTASSTNASVSVFADEWNGALDYALERSEVLTHLNVTLRHEEGWSAGAGGSLTERAFKEVARLVAARGQLGAERDAFYVQLGGFDTHNVGDYAVQRKFAEIDGALSAFVAEAKAQGVWDSVVIVASSEFGRTLTGNGKGTDHGWGGNAFLIGGGVRGGRIHGTYPASYADLSINRRGILIPTSPWEALWSPVAEWLGVEERQLDEVFPNRRNFPAEQLLARGQVFTN